MDENKADGDDDYRNEAINDSVLERVRSAGLLTISPEMFEKLYLNPKTNVKGDLRNTFANPTPLGLIGFVVGLTPFACNLMGWRGTAVGPNTGAANIGDYFFLAGPLLLISGLLEFLLGNTFTFVVFVSYSGIFFTLAATFQPFYNAAGAYSTSGIDSATGSMTPEFNSSFGFFLIACACLNVLYIICATRVNIVFVLIFFTACLGFILAASARWVLAEGNLAVATKLVTGTGASWFATSMLGWYLLALQLFAVMGIAAPFPVGDLSNAWKRGRGKGHDV